MRVLILFALGAAVALAGCGENTGPAGNVSIRFGVAGNVGASPGSNLLSSTSVGGARQGLMVEGDNGILDITRIAVIVEEFELEPVEVTDCDDVDPEPAGCEDFEIRYFFIDIPVDGSDVTVLNRDVPEGMYEELEVEIDELEVDDDDPDDLADAQIIQALLQQIRDNEGFPTWPAEASMAVVGTFTPKDQDGNLGTPVNFTTFFRAEIEVELEPDTPIQIADGNAVTVMVDLRLDSWFRQGSDVIDLSALQSEVVEFELDDDDFELEID